MAAGVPTYVFSHDPAASKPVATTSHSTGAVQWMLLTDGDSWGHHVRVFSYATSNPLAVALTGPTGAHLTVLSVHVGNTVDATVAGSVAATQAGAWTFTGSVQATTVGSVVATQGGAPWSMVGSTHATQAGAWVFTGSVGASQLGAPWTITGSVGATQAGVWSVHVGNALTATVTGSVGATQLGTWSVHVGNTVAATVTGSVVATQGGAPWSTTGSVNASQVGSWLVGVVGPNALQAGVSSYGGDGNLLRVDLVRGSLSAGADGAINDGADATIKARVASLSGGGMLYVFVASQAGGGSTVTGSVVATQGGAPWSVVGSVGATQLGTWSVHVGNAITATVTGSVGATQLGTWSVHVGNTVATTTTGSVVATQGGAPWSIVGSTGATQLGTWSVHVGNTVTATVTGSVAATQAGAWVFTGSVGATQLGAPWTVTGSARVQGQVAHDAAWGGDPLGVGAYAIPADTASIASVGSGDAVRLLADTEGRLRVKVDSGTVAAIQSGTWATTVTGSVAATQVGAWTFTGSVGASQLGAPWSVIGSVQATTVGSVVATQGGAPWSVVGSVGATQLGTWSVHVGNAITATVTGSVGATQLGTWSVHVGNTVAATVTGSVAATQAGAWTFTGSVGATQLGTWSVHVGNTVAATVTGSVAATQAGAWVFTGSVGATQLGTWSAHVGNVVSVVGSVRTANAIATVGIRAIASTVSSVLPMPYDGATAMVRSATAIGESGLWLATDVTTVDLRGFAIMLASSGPAQGQVRTIVSITSSLVATVDSAWESGRVPHSGQVYKLLIDCRNASMVTIATEMSSNNAYVWGTVAQYTVPQSGTATVKPWMDRLRLIDNLASSLEVFQSSYWQGQAVTLNVAGAVGVKYLVTSLTGGRFSQWAGAS